MNAKSHLPDRISIVIPTYNNENTIIETLDSLLILDGRESIEIVISDDASTDKTVELVDQWIARNARDFPSVLFLKNGKNLGISGNHKTAFERVTTKYAMYIGGDDLFYNPGIVTDLSDLLSEKEVAIAKIMVESFTRPSGKIVDMYADIKSFFALDAAHQFAALSLFGNFLYAGPGTVLNIPILREIDGFNTDYSTFEDYPLFLKFLIKGYKIHLFEIKGIFWIRSEYSLSATGFGKCKPQFLDDLRRLDEKYILANIALMPWISRILYRLKGHTALFRVFAKLNRELFGFPR